jgi:3,4-dihydroxy 2-butanone 4-phosphate synthase/GTP cyclohydrolase II
VNSIEVKRLSESRLPTVYGEFTMIAYDSGKPEMPHLVLKKEGSAPDSILDIRIHSECMTGDVFSSLRCDCGEQLHLSLTHIAKNGGALIYLRQEGRGIGLVNKLKAYNLQDAGMDTIVANEALGFHADERDYGDAVAILKDLKIQRVRVLTNNPDKLQALTNAGIIVTERIALEISPNEESKAYLKTKRDSFGHLFGLEIGMP